jgi:hypothetical protein
MTNRENTIKKIIAYFEENEDIFNECIEELDDYSGYLGDNRYYSMYDLDELMESKTPTDLLNMAFFGHDADTYHTNRHGDREYGAFNPNREYFTFNGYGNLISTDYPDYSEYIDKYAIEEMSDNRRWIDAIDDNAELSDLFDELENEDDESDEG